MDIEKAIDCLKADKEYLTDMKICDGEEMDIALLCVLRNLLKSYKICDFRHDCKHGCRKKVRNNNEDSNNRTY